MSLRPVIPYPGAKWRVWDKIKPLIPRDIKDWREPFLGGASISLLVANDMEFNLERMLVGDLATEVWAFWKGCRDYADEVVYTINNYMKESMPAKLELERLGKDNESYGTTYNKAIDEAKKFWDWSQSVDCDTLSLPERAARMYLVAKMSFSGMGDSGTLSIDNFIKFKTDRVKDILNVQPLLKKMEIRNCSYEETMSDVDSSKTFIFLDPPYISQEKSGLYGRNGSTHKGFPHKDFAKFVRELDCRWLMTLDDSIKARRLYRGFNIKPFKFSYTLAGKKSEDALAGEEIFIANYDIDENTSYDLMDLL